MSENMSHNLHRPIYNIKAVSRLVGLLPVTLRAWERRYGLPNPGRGEQGYRLYSEYDVLTLRWLKVKVESGLSIGRAVEYLNDLRSTGSDPAAQPVFQPRAAVQAATPSRAILRSELLDALLRFDEPAAQERLRQAHSIYTLDQVLIDIIQPTLARMGDAWRQGELSMAVEHYATQFFMQHLHNILAAADPPSRSGHIVAACAPGEMHQVGLLMLVILLRWRGWDVKFMGPDLPLERLEDALMSIQPQILMFSASRGETAQKLAGLPRILEMLPEPRPQVILGGQAFREIRLADQLSAVTLDCQPMEAIQRIEDIMAQAAPAAAGKNRSNSR